MITEETAANQMTSVPTQPDSDSSTGNQNGSPSSLSMLENTSPSVSLPSIEDQKSNIQNCDGSALLNELESILTRFVVLPPYAPETLALWILHTHAFELRDVSTYLGIESPEKRCGKTTLLAVLSKLVNRPIAAANISSSAFFRVIEEIRPTLLIDEADTFLRNNDELRGILNAGYTRDTAYVVRILTTDISGLPLPQGEGRGEGEGTVRPPSANEVGHSRHNKRRVRNQPRLTSFSCWCPKVMASIGRLPETLADRCIVIRMQRKTVHEQCKRLRTLETTALRERCAQFVSQNQNAISTAQPEIPRGLHDRAADIWEPLFAIADLAGGQWPAKARRAAEGLTSNAHGRSLIGALLFDIFFLLFQQDTKRLFSRNLVFRLNTFTDRPWLDMPGLRSVDSGQRREVTELWLSRQLRPYGIRPRILRIGDKIGKGYAHEDLLEVFQRYIPKSEMDEFKQELMRRETEEKKPVPNIKP